MTRQISPKERKAAEKRLRQLEAEFVAVQQDVECGLRQQALIILTIHSEALYRVRGQTFSEYIRKQFKWEKSRQRAYQLLDYARTIQEVADHADVLPSELQVRKQLSKLPLSARLMAWKQAVQTTKIRGHVTMEHLAKIVHTFRGQPELASTAPAPDLRKEIEQTLNRFSAENGSNTPDFILAQYLIDCLGAYDKAVTAREKWYGREPKPLDPQPLPPPEGQS